MLLVVQLLVVVVVVFADHGLQVFIRSFFAFRAAPQCGIRQQKAEAWSRKFIRGRRRIAYMIDTRFFELNCFHRKKNTVGVDVCHQRSALRGKSSIVGPHVERLYLGERRCLFYGQCCSKRWLACCHAHAVNGGVRCMAESASSMPSCSHYREPLWCLSRIQAV